MRWKKTYLFHITSLTTDNTGSNTGLHGVRGVLERERRKKWEEIQEGEYIPLIFNGCQDHICHLASMEFEKSLIHRSLCWNRSNQIEGKRHISSVALCHVVSRIKSNFFYRPFRSFVQSKCGKRPRFDRYSETRYASINLLSLQYLKYEKYILLFFLSFKLFLTELDHKYIKVKKKKENKRK